MSDANPGAYPYRWAGQRVYGEGEAAVAAIAPAQPVYPPPYWLPLVLDGDKGVELLMVRGVPVLYRVLDGRGVVAAGSWEGGLP